MIDSRYYDPDRTMERALKALRRSSGVDRKTVRVALVDPDRLQHEGPAADAVSGGDGLDHQGFEKGAVHAPETERDGGSKP